MELSITQVPIWVSISFALFMLTIPTYLIANTVKTAAKRAAYPGAQRLYIRVLFFYLAFFLLIAVVSLSGFFAVNTLPPRILIFVAIPLLVLYFVLIPRQAWFKAIFDQVRLEQLIAIHLFRFVGLYFFIAYSYGVLPRSFAIIGGTGDVLTALLAIPTIYFVRKQVSFAKALIWFWNIFGLLDILSVLSSAIITTRAALATGGDGVSQFGTVPFSWIPAFAPATIIFLHILVFRKLLKR